MHKISTHKAIEWIPRNGNRLDRLRLRNALGKSFPLAEAEEVLSPYQFPAGSWDYESQESASDQVGSLGGTIHCLRWVREFGLGDTPLMSQTVDFLAAIQSSDGSFYETEEKLAHSPHAWLQEDTLIDRFFFTAVVPMRLCSLGHQEQAIIAPAMRWLECHWADWKLVTGTWYNLWAVLCIYPALGRLDPSQYTRCYATALEWLPGLDAQPLTWLLDALLGAGFSKAEPIVAQGVTRLLTLQDANGIWSGGRYPAIETTITALRILRDYDPALFPQD